MSNETRTYFILYNDGPEEVSWLSLPTKQGGKLVAYFTTAARARQFQDEHEKAGGESFGIQELSLSGLLGWLRESLFNGVTYAAQDPVGGKCKMTLILRFLALMEESLG